MKTAIKISQIVLASILVVVACSCGGSSSNPGSSSNNNSNGSNGSGGNTNNVASLIVDAGPGGIGENDLAYTTVTVCVPGTSTCQTIDHVQVDTGSEGLRILSSVLTIPLQPTVSNGNTQFDCVQFADLTFLWGPVAAADIQIAGEKAKSVPVHIINGSNTSPPVPADCSAGQPSSNQIVDVPTLGANAIIGLGVFRQDCGLQCQQNIVPGTYYSCNSGGCSNSTATVTAQLQNPVWLFPSDNNGVIVSLPTIPDSGAASATGSLIFGIGTQSNNGLGNATVIQVDPNQGFFTVKFQTSASSQTFVDNNFIDSGSNGYFFLDSATLENQFAIANIPDCPSNGFGQGFYCPGSEIPFSNNVTVVGNTSNGTPIGSSKTVSFNVGNALNLINSPNTAFNNLGGPNSGSFDFGLPFFFGRSVFTAIEGQSTPGGTGPYNAF